MEHPKISVVTVVFNDHLHIEQTLCSVLNQTYDNIEYIVIDGGSTDGTVSIVKKYEKRLAYWISEPDKGVYDAMNKAISHVTGTYVSFMNSGDSFYSNETLNEVFTKGLDKDVIFGDVFMKYTTVKSFVRRYNNLNPCSLSRNLCHQATFTKSTLLKKYGFDLSYKIAADMNLFTIIYNNGGTFEYIPVVIANYEAEEGLSAKHLKQMYKEYHRLGGVKLYTLSGFKVIARDYLKVIFYNLPFGLNEKFKKYRLRKLYNK